MYFYQGKLGKNISTIPIKMPTKYDTLLLIYVFKTNLSKKKILKENYDTEQKKKNIIARTKHM